MYNDNYSNDIFYLNVKRSITISSTSVSCVHRLFHSNVEHTNEESTCDLADVKVTKLAGGKPRVEIRLYIPHAWLCVSGHGNLDNGPMWVTM